MAEPTDRSVSEILAEAGVALSDSFAGVLRTYAARALNAGISGPEIASIIGSDRTGGALKRAVDSKEQDAKRAADEEQRNAARVEVGLPPSAGFSSSTPQQPPQSNVVDVLGAAGYKWISGNGSTAKWLSPAGVTVTEDEAIVRASAGNPSFEQQLLATGYVPVPGRPGVYFNPITKDTVNLADKEFGGAGSGASAPVARYGFQTIGGKVYRGNDLTGQLEDTGITAPGFTNVDVDRQGNLTGIDADGNYRVIQPGFGFASIDPAVTAAEDRRRFDVGFGENARQFDVAEGGRNARNTESEQAANQRQQLSSQTAGFASINTLAPALGNLALENAKFTKDTLSTPADFLARAFFQRGQTSPLPQISQADVINQLRSNIAGFQSVLSTYGNTFPGFTSPNTAAASSPAASSASAGFSTPSTVVQPGPQPVPQTGFSQPTNVPITLDTATGQWMQGGAVVNPFDSSGNLSVANLGPTPAPTPAPPVGFTAAPAPQPTPTYTSAPITFSAPTLPSPAPVTQQELQALELANRPPAVNDVLNGRMPTPLNVGFSLPTPQMWNALTPDEQKASATTLATQYNTTPEDVGFAINQSFSKPKTRRAATVAGF